jgi:hypothetical protein
MALLWLSSVHAQTGGAGGAFLQLGIGSRAVGMGSAFTGVADDAAAVYWNPAGVGLAHEATHQGMVMYRAMSLDRRQAVMAYRQHLSDAGGGIGAALIHVGVDDIDGRDLNGQPTGRLSDSENAVLFAFSPAVHPRVSVGLTMKLLFYRLAGQSAKGFGGDVGLMVRPVDPLRVGLVFRDIGTRVTWNTTGLFPRSVQRKETWPRTLAFGVSYALLQRRLLVAADVEKPWPQDTRVRIGAECAVAPGITVRAGANDGHAAAGTSIVTNLWAARVRLHYGFLTDRLGGGETHVIEWEIGF